MAAHHDVKNLGGATVKLPDGQELELPLLQVIFSICSFVFLAPSTLKFFNE